MGAPDSIRSICTRYREIFPSDESMGRSLGIGASEAGGMVKGVIYPSIASMIVIQAALRKLALAEEQSADLFWGDADELTSRKRG